MALTATGGQPTDQAEQPELYPPSRAPEPGQLARVRGRMWVVADAARDTQAALDGRPVQHVISLVSVEDDATGEELQVVWEIEPGTQIIEQAELPRIARDALDDPAELEAFLDAVRWGAVTSADQSALQAPFRSGITIEDYQLEPLVRALRMPRTTLLIADDVGLGKTIEAGLVVQELLLRHRARTALVVCPAALQVQWRDELREKFGLEFRIVDRELLGQLRRSRGVGANPFSHFPRLIVSIDWVKAELGMRLLREVLPPHPEIPRRYDILIVDEVHNCAPAGAGGRYARDTLQNRGDPHAGPALRAPAVPVGDAAQRLRQLVRGAARAARPASLRARHPAGAAGDARGRRAPPQAGPQARRRVAAVRASGDRDARGRSPAAGAGGARRPRRLRCRPCPPLARRPRPEARRRLRHDPAEEAPLLLAGGVPAHARGPPGDPHARRRSMASGAGRARADLRRRRARRGRGAHRIRASAPRRRRRSRRPPTPKATNRRGRSSSCSTGCTRGPSAPR